MDFELLNTLNHDRRTRALRAAEHSRLASGRTRSTRDPAGSGASLRHPRWVQRLVDRSVRQY